MRLFWREKDSNLRHRAYGARKLPTALSRCKYNYTKDSNLNSPCRPVSFIVRPYCRSVVCLMQVVSYRQALLSSTRAGCAPIHHIIDRNFEFPTIASCLQPLMLLLYGVNGTRTRDLVSDSHLS